MSATTLLDGLAFLVGNLAAVVIATAIAARAVPANGSAFLRASAGIAAYILLVSLLVLLLGTVGLLDPHLAAGLLVVPAIVAGFSLRNAGPGAPPARLDTAGLREASPLLAIGLGLGAWWLVRNLALGTYITNDDNTYHAAILAQWLRDGRIDIVATTYQAYFPLNGELLSLWFLLPFGHDGAVPLNGLVYLALFIGLSLHFAERLGAPRIALGLPAVLTLASVPTFFGLTTFTDLDFSPPVMVLAAVALLLAALEGKDNAWSDHGRLLMLLGGACAGFAVGMKVSFAPPIAILCLIFAFTAWRRLRLPEALGSSALVAGAVVLAGGYWYARNWLLTGNPLYPAAVGPFAGPFEAETQAATKLSEVVAVGLGASEWRQLIDGFLNRPWPIAAVVIGGWIAGVVVLLRGRSAHSDQRPLVIVLLAISAVVTLLFPVTPFSGTNEVGGLESTGRYLNLLYLCGGLLAVLLLKPLAESDTSSFRFRLLWLLVALAAFVLPFCWQLPRAAALAVIGAVVVAFAALELAPRLPGGLKLRLPAPRYAVLVLPLIALASVPLNLRSTDRVVLERPLMTEVEALPAGSVVAQFNGWLYQGYVLGGRRQQHQAVRLDGDGRRYTPFHLRTDDDRGLDENFWIYERHHGEAELDAATLVRHLRKANIDFLIVSPHPDGDWPVQHQLLLEAAAFPIHHRDADGVIWDLRPPVIDAEPPPPPPLSDLQTDAAPAVPTR